MNDDEDLKVKLGFIMGVPASDPRLEVVVALVRYAYTKGRPGIGYGPGWHAARNAVHARDRVCVHCGSSDDLEVHHVRPVRLFRDKRKAHDLANLKLLCSPCHAAADKAFRAEERVSS